VNQEEKIAHLEAMLAERDRTISHLAEALRASTCAPQTDRAWPARSRVTAKPEALAWARRHPGVPLPPTEPEEDVPEFQIRLRTPEEQAAYLAEEEARMAPIRAAQAERARLKARRWVYFIQAGDTGPVKIGISGNVERRLGELQRMERQPLRVLATFEGNRSDEKSLHEMYAAHRIHGEWFNPAPEIIQNAHNIAAAEVEKR
jgi:hypothetical protein